MKKTVPEFKTEKVIHFFDIWISDSIAIIGSIASWGRHSGGGGGKAKLLLSVINNQPFHFSTPFVGIITEVHEIHVVILFALINLCSSRP